MAEFLVTWRIDIDAATPQEAAEKALAIHRKHDSIATVFEVQEKLGLSGPLGEVVKIDLTPECDEDEVDEPTFDTIELAIDNICKELGHTPQDWHNVPQLGDIARCQKTYQAGKYVVEIYQEAGKFNWSVVSEHQET